jgi:hypothetical protein
VGARLASGRDDVSRDGGFIAVSAPWIGYCAIACRSICCCARFSSWLGLRRLLLPAHPIVLGLSLQLALSALIFVGLPRFTESWLGRPARLLIPRLWSPWRRRTCSAAGRWSKGLYNAVGDSAVLVYPLTLALRSSRSLMPTGGRAGGADRQPIRADRRQRAFLSADLSSHRFHALGDGGPARHRRRRVPGQNRRRRMGGASLGSCAVPSW